MIAWPSPFFALSLLSYCVALTLPILCFAILLLFYFELLCYSSTLFCLPCFAIVMLLLSILCCVLSAKLLCYSITVSHSVLYMICYCIYVALIYFAIRLLCFVLLCLTLLLLGSCFPIVLCYLISCSQVFVIKNTLSSSEGHWAWPIISPGPLFEVFVFKH